MSSTSTKRVSESTAVSTSKRVKKQSTPTSTSTSTMSSDPDVATVIVQFVTPDGETTGSQLQIPYSITPQQMTSLINDLLKNDEPLPYAFFHQDDEIISGLDETLIQQAQKQGKDKPDTENIISIVYQPQAIFRVRAVTRCTASLPGHTEAVLHVSFSADGKHLASGSGDTTVRIWDVQTQTPRLTLQGHKNWVMAVAWAPTGKLVASGSMDGELRLWDPITGKLAGGGKPLNQHRKTITSIAWEPLHLNYSCQRVATASKDGDIKIWDVNLGSCLLTLAGHTMCVTALRWGGEGLIYSASQDRSIKVWETVRGKLVRTLDGHAHWVNTLSCNTDYAIRTGPYDHNGHAPEDAKQAQQACLEKYQKALATVDGEKCELLVSGSDDFTLYLWNPAKKKQPIVRMTGHQQPVNFVAYSPDGRYIASASFDKSVRIWDGRTGRFLAKFHSHVQAVYQVCWSGDSRLVCSSSKDSTLKVWDIKTRKVKFELPGHADEVYACDWSPDGERVASGGKDRILKIWSN